MERARVLAGLLILIVSVQMPIWIYIMYKILYMIGASELMWFLFYCYIPVSIFSRLVVQIVKGE
jgi:hypothetical protein